MADEHFSERITDRRRDFDDLGARMTWAGLGSTTHPEGRRGRPTRSVTGPGLAALNAVGDRAVRPAAGPVTVDVGARDNWRPTGPRNVTGRMRAIAVEPGNANVLYAGAASGGIWKTEDGGERWFPLWHDEPSLAFGAIAVAPSRPQRVYAATGEIEPAGLNVAGHGIRVSDDRGANWTNKPPARVAGANPPHERGFEALAVDPANPDHCWAVGGDGIFRTVNGGVDWQRFVEGTHFSDVAFSGDRLWLARATSQAGEAALIRLDPPASTIGATEGAVRTALAAADNLTVVVPAVPDHLAWPARSKLAISPSAPTVGFVRVADEDGRHVGLFRSRNARATPARTVTWQRLPDHPDWAEEEQGRYNLCLAVHPTLPDQVATGMVDMHVSTNANNANQGAVTFRRAMSWDLYTDDRGFHADNHALLVVGGTLWAANDGGLAASTNWATGEEVGRSLPLDPKAITWRRRDHGISASHAYDLNQSPLVPTLYAVGLQDNGVHLTAGGPTWRMVNIADGGFVLFDPDDPFRFMTTWYNEVDAQQFPGHLDRLVPGEQPDVPVGESRSMEDGFRPLDEPAFAADTARHRLRRDRVLHTRKRRVYGTRGARGERWDVEPVGHSFEIVAASDTDTVEVQVLPTDGAVRLGLLPGTKVRRFPYDPLTDPKRLRALVPVSSRLPAPWRLTDGDELRLRINGTDAVARFQAADVANIGAVTLPEVLRTVQAVLPAGNEVLPRLWPTARAVELVTRARGAAQNIKLEGTALTPQGDGLSRLGLNAGTYAGDDDRPASLSLAFEGELASERATNRNLSGAPALTLTVTVNGGAPGTITFQAPEFVDPGNVTAGELAAALAAKLPAAEVDVIATDVFKAVLLIADPGTTVSLSGTATDRFDLNSTEAERIELVGPTRRSQHRGRHVRNHNSFDLSTTGPAPLTLTINDGTTSTGPLAITGADVANLRAVTVEELHRLIRRHLAPTPAIRVRAELVADPQEAQATEITLAPSRPDEAWIGGADGSVFVFRSTDDGRAATWEKVVPPDALLADARIEAIALHPTEDRVAYAGLFRLRPGPADRGLLFRTGDRGSSWQQVGSRRAGADLVGIVGDGRPLAVFALELDPVDPRIVFAATEGGVFRSRDEGGTWEPFNHGLPNCPVIDLALVEQTRTLRAAAWGRGTWERRIGAEPPDDVRLVVRSSELDDGTRPPRGGPNLFADAPTADPPVSPDIKVVRRRPDHVGADPRVDGVEFDFDLPDDVIVDQPAGPGPDHQSEIVVQVHNRGSFPARSTAAPPPPPTPDASVRVVVLWARLNGPPPPLPLDFWTRFKTASLQAAEGEWQRAADRRLEIAVQSDGPAVVGVPVTWPRDIGSRRIGILVLVTATDDVLDGGPTDVAELVALERRAAFRSVQVVPAADDRTLVLRATGSRQFEVHNPLSGTTVADRLQIAPADLVTLRRRLRAGSVATPAYNLAVATPPGEPGLLVMEDLAVVDVELHNDDGEFAAIAAAAPTEVARFIEGRLRVAGAAATAFASPVGIRLRGLGGARVRVVDGNAASRLGLAPMAPAAAVAQLDARKASGFDLRGNRVLRLEVRAQANRTLEVTFLSERFRDAERADARRIALLLNQAIALSRLEGVLKCDVILGIVISGKGEAELTVAGTAAAPLGLGGTGTFVRSDPGVVDLSGRPQLRISVQNQVTVRFDRDATAIPDLSNAAPPAVRRVLNRAFEIAELSVRAEAARFDLRVGGSPTETTEAPVTLGGQSLAEVATSGTTPAADPTALFGLRSALAPDRLTEVAPNHVYVRVRNAGNIDVRPARVRLFRVDPTVTPTVTSVVAGTIDVDAERAAVADLLLTPAAAAGAYEHVIAVVDQDAEGRRAPDPAAPDLESLVALCERRADMAMRTFEVVEP